MVSKKQVRQCVNMIGSYGAGRLQLSTTFKAHISIYRSTSENIFTVEAVHEDDGTVKVSFMNLKEVCMLLDEHVDAICLLQYTVE